jgi:carboxypeptidase Taq
MGEAVSLGVHESQSRLWENRVGRSADFWAHFLPRARELFPAALDEVGLDEFVLAINRVEPSAIRVRADEVTYNLHTLIRFELERAMVAGDLDVADVPAAWNQLYREYLGVTPADDAEGCLQDGHWSSGLIGYFPAYTIGDVCAAQLFARASADLGDLPAAFREGRFEPLRTWLRERVHRHGHRWRTTALLERAAGAPPDPAALVDTLRRKYAELYGL